MNKHETIERETERQNQKVERGDASPQIHFPLALFMRRRPYGESTRRDLKERLGKLVKERLHERLRMRTK